MNPGRGEVWFAELPPPVGHEQGGNRPVLIVSDDTYNQGPAGLVVIVPLSTKQKRGALRLPLEPPEGGVKAPCVLLCEAVRSIAQERLTDYWGVVEPATLALVEDRLRILLGL